MAAPVAQESGLAISDRVVERHPSYGEAKRPWSVPGSQSASRAWTGPKTKVKTAAATALEEDFFKHRARGSSLEAMAMPEDLPALAAKIEHALSIKSEYVVTQPAELRILREMSQADVKDFATTHGWRVIRRLGGRQIEFYNDASERVL